MSRMKDFQIDHPELTVCTEAAARDWVREQEALLNPNAAPALPFIVNFERRQRNMASMAAATAATAAAATGVSIPVVLPVVPTPVAPVKPLRKRFAAYRSYDGRPKVKVFRPRKSRAKIEGPIPEKNQQLVVQWMRRQKDGGYYEWVARQVYDAIARAGVWTDHAKLEIRQAQRDRFEDLARDLRQAVWMHIARKAHLYQDRGYKHGPMAWLSQTVRWFCKDYFKNERNRQRLVPIYSAGENPDEEAITLYRSPGEQTCNGIDIDPDVAEIYLAAVNRPLAGRKTFPKGHGPDDDDADLHEE